MGSDMRSFQCTSENTVVLTSSNASSLMYTDLERISATYVLPCILLVGLLGNTAFLFVVARIRSMRTVTNFYLVNLAVADMVFLSVVIAGRTYSLAAYGVPNRVLGVAACISDTLFAYTFHFAGLILITFMSLERYVAVCHPLRHRLLNGRNCTATLVTVCWFTSMALAALLIPSVMLYNITCVAWPSEDIETYKRFPTAIGSCDPLDSPWVIQLFHSTQTIPFFVAFFGNSYFYARIVFKLHRRSSPGDRQRVIRTRNHVAIMLVANGVVFFLTLTAFEVTSVILFIEGFLDSVIIPYDIRNSLFEANRVLLYINSAVNPIVYTLTNDRYRRAFRRAFTPASWARRRTGNDSLFSIYPNYYSQYHTKTGDIMLVTRPQSPVKSPMVARPATYSNACFDLGEFTVNNEDHSEDIEAESVSESLTHKRASMYTSSLACDQASEEASIAEREVK